MSVADLGFLICATKGLLPGIFYDGLERDLMEVLGVFEGKKGRLKPWVEVPGGEGDELAWEVRFIRKRRRKPVGQGDPA